MCLSDLPGVRNLVNHQASYSWVYLLEKVYLAIISQLEILNYAFMIIFALGKLTMCCVLVLMFTRREKTDNRASLTENKN